MTRQVRTSQFEFKHLNIHVKIKGEHENPKARVFDFPARY